MKTGKLDESKFRPYIGLGDRPYPKESTDQNKKDKMVFCAIWAQKQAGVAILFSDSKLKLIKDTKATTT